MRFTKMILRLIAVILIAIAIIAHNTWVAIAAVVITSLNLGILVGEKMGKKETV